MAGDWQDIKDDREKYQAYLCSREWSELKEAVHARARGRCERCRIFPIDAVHHLTYARKYHETLEDLEGHCTHCHAFTHGKDAFDPVHWRGFSRYIAQCITNQRKPLPYQIQDNLVVPKKKFRFLMVAIDQLNALMQIDDYEDFQAIEEAIELLNSALGFDYIRAVRWGIRWIDVQDYDALLTKFGFPRTPQEELMDPDPDEDGV